MGLANECAVVSSRCLSRPGMDLGGLERRLVESGVFPKAIRGKDRMYCGGNKGLICLGLLKRKEASVLELRTLHGTLGHTNERTRRSTPRKTAVVNLLDTYENYLLACGWTQGYA